MQVRLKRGASTAVAMLAAVALVSGCGNRNDYATLKADATGISAAPSLSGAPAPGSDVTGGMAPSATSAQVATAPGSEKPVEVKPAHGLAATGTVPAPGEPRNGANVAPPSASSAAPAPKACSQPLAPIKIGSIGHYSGITGALFGPGLQGLQVWVSWKNAAGGIACHPIELTVGDDGTDPAKTQSLTREFVEQKKVVAFVFMSSAFTGQTVTGYLTERRIPVFGGSGAESWLNEYPTYFPQTNAGPDAMEASFALPGTLQVPKGNTKLAMVACVEAPLCSSVYGDAPGYAKKFGMDLVYRGQVTLTQPNYTANCLAAKNAGAQMMWLGIDGASMNRLARDCEGVGFRPRYIMAAVSATNAQFAYPAVSGIQVMLLTRPWTDTQNQGIAEYLAALTKFAPGLLPGGMSLAGWVAAQVFGTAAAKVGAQPSSDQILQGAYQIKNNDFGGITRKLTYSAGAPNQRQKGLCWWALQFDGPKVSSPNNSRETCS